MSETQEAKLVFPVRPAPSGRPAIVTLSARRDEQGLDLLVEWPNGESRCFMVYLVDWPAIIAFAEATLKL